MDNPSVTLICRAFVLIGLIFQARAEVVYRNTNRVSSVELGGETGHTIILAGSRRVITKFACELTAKPTLAGNQAVRIRFYQNTLERWGVSPGMSITGGPAELIYDSGDVPVEPGGAESNYAVTLKVTNLNVRVPDYFTWTIEGTSASPSNDHLQIAMSDGPELGRNGQFSRDFGQIWVG